MKACLASPTVAIWANPVIRYYRVTAHMLGKNQSVVFMRTNIYNNRSIWQIIQLKSP